MYNKFLASMVKLVNIADLKSAVERLVGSSPTTRTNYAETIGIIFLFLRLAANSTFEQPDESH
jgi:hypothetical protein